MTDTTSLLPRREEIYFTIKEHGTVNFEFLHRRFFAVNPRTLRNDIKKLQEAGLIRKRGVTNGACYEIIEKDLHSGNL